MFLCSNLLCLLLIFTYHFSSFLKDGIWCESGRWELASWPFQYNQWYHFKDMGKAWCVSFIFIALRFFCHSSIASCFHSAAFWFISFYKQVILFAVVASSLTHLSWRQNQREYFPVNQLSSSSVSPQTPLYRFNLLALLSLSVFFSSEWTFLLIMVCFIRRHFQLPYCH
jgi:hypothetical protein